MRRTLHTTLSGTISGPATVYGILAAAATYAPGQESLLATIDGHRVEVCEIAGPHGTRLHRFGPDAPTERPVDFTLAYDAVIEGRAPAAPGEPVDLPTYLRPSRYCESDRFGALARENFAGLSGLDLADAVCGWVRRTLDYVAGSTGPSDSTVDVLRTHKGVCRDYAHLVVTMLRARNMPARFVGVWAPGLDPMEFHAVAEVWVDGRWLVLDPTDLAPRQAMVRIATGRDAADTAFLSSYGAGLSLRRYLVRAEVDELPVDDHVSPVVLA
ncbi:Transglutaminase-like enzyme, putative cysteine protease [Raineyella antarctica]|uniref:Transglutaminase-like enzyme, putative cysteine protease n=1 Tax=Raineyella antarctica TaxID=1577474 RepID=A0A1G6GE61_9ACTN|nr:transglutaminase family protein [Raineyella antarctica]SDB80302.1 Transglutaminase-like enzyme, putative cysteine protease [Raineyella antarctica]